MSDENPDDLTPIDFFMQYSEDKKYISLHFSCDDPFDGPSLLQVLSTFIEQNTNNIDKIFEEEFAFRINLH